MAGPGAESRGPLAQAISQNVVRLMRDYTGRGPTRVHTVINDDAVMVVLRDTLLKAERSLIDDGEGQAVVGMRRLFQATMEEELVACVEQIMGRSVEAFLSDNHVDPDIAVEVFILHPRSAP